MTQPNSSPKIELRKDLMKILINWHYENIREDGVFQLENFIFHHIDQANTEEDAKIRKIILKINENWQKRVEEEYEVGVKDGMSVVGSSKEIKRVRREERERVIEEIEEDLLRACDLNQGESVEKWWVEEKEKLKALK